MLNPFASALLPESTQKLIKARLVEFNDEGLDLTKFGWQSLRSILIAKFAKEFEAIADQVIAKQNES